jgi:hypothetical protein
MSRDTITKKSRKLCDIVDKIYIISMPGCDRQSGVIDVCRQLGVEYEFYWKYYEGTVNGHSAFPPNHSNGHIPTYPFPPNIIQPRTFFESSYNRKCLSLTRHHTDIYRRIAHETNPNYMALVLEDDARIFDITTWQLTVPPKFDAITLSRGLSKTDTNNFERDFKIHNCTNSTDCILVTPQYCRKFIDFYENGITEIQFDHLSNIFLRSIPNIKFFHSNKYLTWNSSLEFGSQLR